MALTVGAQVPDFEIETTGGVFRLSDIGERALVLYFYPKDNTPGCTAESQQFRDALPQFAAAGATILGVSRDSLGSHQRFKSRLELPYELGSDSAEALCTAFAVMKNKTMYGRPVRGIERSTFVIGPDRRLLREWRGLRVPGHVDEVLAFVRSLRPHGIVPAPAPEAS